MGLFDKLRKDLKSEVRTDNSGWENMAGDAPAETEILDNTEKEKANQARQKQKLIQALLPGNGSPDTSAIVGEPREAGPHDENIVLAKIAVGQIGKKDFETILNGIKGPLTDSYGEFDEKRSVDTLERIAYDKHQSKILAFVNDFNVDEHYMDTDFDDLAKATSTYKNPMQFEAKMEPFMTFLAEHNSPQKVKEYETAMRELEKNLFGKKFEYYERMKELVADSERIFGKPAENPFTPSEIKTDEEEPPFRPEHERNHEKLIKGGSFYQASRAQVKNGMRAEMGQRLPFDQTCEDSSFVDPDKGFFGVFDGAGGHEGGRRASSIGAETMADLMMHAGEPKTPDDLANWLDEASRRVKNDPAAGMSTATLAKVIKRPDGGKAVMYAQVGDSRLYIVRKDGRAELVTKDEGFEKYITNALGGGNEKTCVQAGYRELNDGDKIVLCSDGITGDKGDDLMSEDELGRTVMGAGDTAYAAQALVHQARKSDDRTAIVAEV